MPQITVDVEATLTAVRVDPTGPRLYLQGVLREVGVPDGPALRSFSEDVTDLLTAQQIGYLTAIVTRAQAWLDAKVAG